MMLCAPKYDRAYRQYIISIFTHNINTWIWRYYLMGYNELINLYDQKTIVPFSTHWRRKPL